MGNQYVGNTFSVFKVDCFDGNKHDWQRTNHYSYN